MRAPLSRLAIGISLCFLSSSFALSRPVHTYDFEGKTICWDTGLIDSFGPAGHPGTLTNNRSGAGAWEVTEKGLVTKPRQSDKEFVQKIELNENVTLTVSGPAPGADDRSGDGHYCRTGSATIGRPATVADFANKKRCWDVGQVETYGPPSHPMKGVNDHWGEFIFEITDDKGNGWVKWPNAGADADTVFPNHWAINDDGTMTASGPVPGLDNWSGDSHYCRPGEEGTAPK